MRCSIEKGFLIQEVVSDSGRRRTYPYFCAKKSGCRSTFPLRLPLSLQRSDSLTAVLTAQTISLILSAPDTPDTTTMAEVIQPTPPPAGPGSVNGDAANDEKENAPPLSSQSENITVFHDVSNFNVKHPLMNTWTLWFTRPPSSKVRVIPLHPK